MSSIDCHREPNAALGFGARRYARSLGGVDVQGHVLDPLVDVAAFDVVAADATKVLRSKRFKVGLLVDDAYPCSADATDSG